jgi:hypothetical protein
MPQSTELLPGALDLLILQTLSLEPIHGWGVAQRIQQLSNEVLRAGQGSLYPALYRLEYKGGSDRNGGSRRITGGRSFIFLPRRAKSSGERNRQPGIGCPRRSGLYFAGSRRRPHDL